MPCPVILRPTVRGHEEHFGVEEEDLRSAVSVMVMLEERVYMYQWPLAFSILRYQNTSSGTDSGIAADCGYLHLHLGRYHTLFAFFTTSVHFLYHYLLRALLCGLPSIVSRKSVPDYEKGICTHQCKMYD